MLLAPTYFDYDAGQYGNLIMKCIILLQEPQPYVHSRTFYCEHDTESGMNWEFWIFLMDWLLQNRHTQPHKTFTYEWYMRL